MELNPDPAKRFRSVTVLKIDDTIMTYRYRYCVQCTGYYNRQQMNGKTSFTVQEFRKKEGKIIKTRKYERIYSLG
jgi:hypothetical protein